MNTTKQQERKEELKFMKQNIIEKVEQINKATGRKFQLGYKPKTGYFLIENPWSTMWFMNKTLEQMHDTILDIKDLLHSEKLDIPKELLNYKKSE